MELSGASQYQWNTDRKLIGSEWFVRTTISEFRKAVGLMTAIMATIRSAQESLTKPGAVA